MGETRKIAAILVADIVGYGQPAGADEDRTLSRPRGLRSDLIDPAIAVYYAASSNAPGTALLQRLRGVGGWANSRYRQ